jgi:hypothetical protein
MHRFRRVTRLSWGVLKDALGPARYASTVLSWWPPVVAVLAASLAVLGISVPDHLRLSAAWWIAIFLGSIAALFARSAYGSHSMLDPEFPHHRVDFGIPSYVEKGKLEDIENDLVLFDVIYTNRESRRVNLEIDLFWEWRLTTDDIVGPFRLNLNKKGRGNAGMLGELLDVGPETTESRLAVFDTGPATGMKPGPWRQVLMEPDHRLFVRLIDRVSGAEIRLPLPVQTVAIEEEDSDDEGQSDDAERGE